MPDPIAKTLHPALGFHFPGNINIDPAFLFQFVSEVGGPEAAKQTLAAYIQLSNAVLNAQIAFNNAVQKAVSAGER